MPSIEVANLPFTYDRDPDRCPLCHHGIQAERVVSKMIRRGRAAHDPTILQTVYRCPRDECKKLFIATYAQDRRGPAQTAEGDHLLRTLAPNSPREPETPDEIKALSPSYHVILGQSMAAEAHQLHEIAGCGYRKALEFLVKDYAIHKNPSDAEAIKKTMLGPCIKTYVTDANVKKCAELATWLGNDETHYVRKWTTKDINDLKILLRLTSSWISNELLTEKYVKEMKP